MEDWTTEQHGAQLATEHMPVGNCQLLDDMNITEEECDYLIQALSTTDRAAVADSTSNADSCLRRGEQELEVSIWAGYDNFLHCIFGGTKSNL